MAVYDRVVIVGVGLLGGSIGLAVRERGLAGQIVGWGRRLENLKRAISLGVIDSTTDDLQAACQNADLVVVCTPVQLVANLVRQCVCYAKPGALITDVGSTKGSIVHELADTPQFCGSHPLAGSDRSGAEFADASLFEGKMTVVTPAEHTLPGLVERTETLWQSLGSRTIRMSPEDHDQALAKTSHLPHVLASALAGSTPESLLPLVASGWCDTTRVAAGSVELWLQILQENRTPVLAALEEFHVTLHRWIETLRNGDDEQLASLLATGKQIRDSLGN